MIQNFDANKQVGIFNTTLLNIFQNFIPNEKIIINDKDPPWITQSIKSKILQVRSLYEYYIRNGNRNADYESVLAATNTLNRLIKSSKSEYYRNLSSKLTNTKTFPFLNKKTPKILPLFMDGSVITDFKMKASLFNSHFAKQCSIIENTSNLPEQNTPSEYSFSSINLNDDKLLSLIQSLDVSKSHGHDNISIRMIKICESSIIKPLMTIFRNYLNAGIFPIILEEG